MLAHDYRIGTSISEYNFSGLHSTKTVYFSKVRNFKPTVNNIEKLVKDYYPEKKIDTRFESIKQQISNGLDIGMICIHFMSKDDFINYSMVLYEII